MKVYVVEKGCYNDRYIAGVYASPEAAMAAHPPREPNRSPRSLEREGGWQQDEYGWTNGLDWDAAAEVREYDLEGCTVKATA